MLVKETIFGVVDVETTGLDHEKDQIVEMAILSSCVSGLGTSTWSSLFKPTIPIPAMASSIHHITDEDVAHANQWSDSYIHEYPAYAAHNAEFDNGFLKLKQPIVCTMRLAQKLWPDLESYGNQFLRYHLKLNPPLESNDKTHRALPDAIVTASLLVHELNEVISRSKAGEGATVEDLVKWIEAPMLLTTCRFGKHKGKLWAEVPKDYLRWILKSFEDADRDTIHTAQHYSRM